MHLAVGSLRFVRVYSKDQIGKVQSCVISRGTQSNHIFPEPIIFSPRQGSDSLPVGLMFSAQSFFFHINLKSKPRFFFADSRFIDHVTSFITDNAIIYKDWPGTNPLIWGVRVGLSGVITQPSCTSVFPLPEVWHVIHPLSSQVQPERPFVGSVHVLKQHWPRSSFFNQMVIHFPSLAQNTAELSLKYVDDFSLFPLSTCKCRFH